MRDTTWRRRLQFHAVALGIVALAILFGQIVTLLQTPSFHLTSDSPRYFEGAARILQGGPISTPLDTGGYSLFLVPFVLLNGTGHVAYIVYAQMLLMVLSVFEVYVLTYRITGQRWIGAVVACILALNVYVLNWEREIMTEALAFWMIITVFLMFEHALRTSSNRWLVGALLFSGLTVVERPLYVYVPAVLIVVLVYRAVRLRAVRATWKPMLIAATVGYGVVGLVILSNLINFGYGGVSYVSTINMLGKIMEYHMENLAATPQDMAISQQITAYLQTSPETEPWHFLIADPQYTSNYLAPIASYASDIIDHHPITFIGDGIPDIVLTLGAPPRDYAPVIKPTRLLDFMLNLSADALLSYWLLPALALIAIIWMLFTPQDTRLVLLGTIALLVGVDVIMSGALTYQTILKSGFIYNEFYRMRVPCDWAMFLLTITVPLMGIQALWQRRTASRTRVAVAAVPPSALDAETPTLVMPRIRLRQPAEVTTMPLPIVPPAPEEIATMPLPSVPKDGPPLP
jgi:hypothetical protein